MSSPFGTMLASSAAPLASNIRAGNVSVKRDRWRRCVQGTQLQWWGPEPAVETATTGCDAADVVVDFFGKVGSAMDNVRRWRVVDAGGEPILNSYCFLETCCRSPFVASVFLVEKLVSEPNWTIIEQAHISAREWYRTLLENVAKTAAFLIRSALRKRLTLLSKGEGLQTNNRSRSSAQIALETIRIRASKAAMILRHESFNERWAVGLVNAPASTFIVSGSVRPEQWVEAPKDAFFADPFPFPDASNVFLCERYDYKKKSGELHAITIKAGRVSDDRPVELGIGNGHKSYPYTFRENGRAFLLPEMASAGKLVLFELLSETTTRAVAVIDLGTPMADATLFKHDGLYWIGYTDLGFGRDDNLCLLYASQLEGPWTRHPLNPVKVDIRSSRPGGTPFVINGELFRPAQDCSTTYGSALAINVVRTCSPAAFEEETVAKMSPDPLGRYPHGLHTLAINGTRTLIDGKRMFFDRTRFARWILSRIGRSLRGK